MPRYVIERQYLLPVYQHLLIEASCLDAACREALDEDAHPWGDDAEEDFDTAGPVTLTRAVQLPEPPPLGFEGNDDPTRSALGNALYGAGHDPLPIPAEFTSNYPSDGG
jgi:hypothetical protein